MVRRQKGRLVAVARFAELDELDAYEKVVRAAVEERPVEGPSFMASLAPFTNLPEDFLGHLCAVLLATGDDGVHTDELLHVALGAPAGRGAASGLLGFLARPRAERLLDRLVELGVVTVTDAQPCADCDEEHRTATLTAAGVPFAVDLAREAGFEVAVRPEPATATAREIADLVGLVDPDDWRLDAVAWFAAQPDPAPAAAALVAEIAAADRELVAAAAGLSWVDDVLGEHAVDAVRAQLDGPHDGVVVQWLVAHSALDPASIDPARLVRGLVDVMASALDTGGPAEVVACIAPGSTDEQLTMLSEIWRLHHPRLGEVLDAIGAQHPAKAVAKAARRSLMKHRSRLAGG